MLIKYLSRMMQYMHANIRKDSAINILKWPSCWNRSSKSVTRVSMARVIIRV